jgi:hypothetical protein
MRLLPSMLRGLVLAACLGACIQLGSGGGGGGSTSGGGDTSPIPLPPSGGAVACLAEGSGCTNADATQTYAACVLAQCDTAYAACFGAGARSGAFDGDCKDWGVCASACVGCDATCLAGCEQQHVTPTCGECIAQQLQPCVSVAVHTGQCAAPCSRLGDAGASTSGTDAGAGAGSGACLALTTCCNALPQEDATRCQTSLTEANDVDAACTNVLATYKASGNCP